MKTEVMGILLRPAMRGFGRASRLGSLYRETDCGGAPWGNLGRIGGSGKGKQVFRATGEGIKKPRHNAAVRLIFFAPRDFEDFDFYRAAGDVPLYGFASPLPHNELGERGIVGHCFSGGI